MLVTCVCMCMCVLITTLCTYYHAVCYTPVRVVAVLPAPWPSDQPRAIELHGAGAGHPQLPHRVAVQPALRLELHRHAAREAMHGLGVSVC